VQVADPKTLVIPDYKGNALFFWMRNILANPRVGMLFMITGVEWTLRVGGRARILDDPETLARFDQASPAGRGLQLAIEVTVEECYFHCPKAFVSSQLWEGLPHQSVELPPLYGG